jgi:hypothetical protein
MMALVAGHFWQPVAVAADLSATRFCIVPVVGGASSEGITDTKFLIPGLAPVFTPTTRDGVWTINADRRLVSYTAPFPRTFLDRWVVEPWSRRVVATTHNGPVSVLRPGTRRFEVISGDSPQHQGFFGGPFVLPRRKETIILSKGLPLVVEDSSLRPWLSSEQLNQLAPKGIASLLDIPSFPATVVIDKDMQVSVLDENNSWHRVTSLPKDDFGALVFDVPDASTALLMTAKSVVALRKGGSTTSPSFRADTLRTTKAIGASAPFHRTRLFGHVLTFLPEGHWRRLTASGFVEIPGGDIGLGRPDLFPNGRLQDLATLRRTLVEGRDGLYLYDGARMTRIPDSDRDRLGELPSVYDLPSIGRVLIAGRRGLFELSREERLVPVRMPFPSEGLPALQFADWPEAGVALAATQRGIFVIDQDLNAVSIPGGDQVDLGSRITWTVPNPNTGEPVLVGNRGMFIAIDTNHSGDQPCRRFRERAERIPASDICLRPIAGSDAKSIGFAVGDMVEAPRGNGLLFETIRGLFHQAIDGRITALQTRTGRYTPSLATLPWSDEVVSSGPDAMIIHDDLSMEHLPIASNALFGQKLVSIRALTIEGPDIKLLSQASGRHRLIDLPLRRGPRAIVDAPWLGGPVVSTAGGLFIIGTNGRLKQLELREAADVGSSKRTADEPQSFSTAHLFAIERFRSVYARGSGWIRITDDRRWHRINGLPREAVTWSTLDPGSDKVLLLTDQGLFVINEDGWTSKIRGAKSFVFTTIGREIGSGAILAGGDGGLFRVNLDSSELTAVANATNEYIGTVRRIVDVPFANVNVVEASNGTYALQDGKLSIIRDLAAAAQLSGVSMFPHLRRMLAKGRADEGPLLFEVGRRDPAGACTQPLSRQ